MHSLGICITLHRLIVSSTFSTLSEFTEELEARIKSFIETRNKLSPRVCMGNALEPIIVTVDYAHETDPLKHLFPHTRPSAPITFEHPLTRSEPQRQDPNEEPDSSNPRSSIRHSSYQGEYLSGWVNGLRLTRKGAPEGSAAARKVQNCPRLFLKPLLCCRLHVSSAKFYRSIILARKFTNIPGFSESTRSNLSM